jgi:hypothetical protein
VTGDSVPNGVSAFSHLVRVVAQNWIMCAYLVFASECNCHIHHKHLHDLRHCHSRWIRVSRGYHERPTRQSPDKCRGFYTATVPYGWSGTVAPSLGPYYIFSPASASYLTSPQIKFKTSGYILPYIDFTRCQFL